jgi:hypothetical protein
MKRRFTIKNGRLFTVSRSKKMEGQLFIQQHLPYTVSSGMCIKAFALVRLRIRGPTFILMALTLLSPGLQSGKVSLPQLSNDFFTEEFQQLFAFKLIR